MDGYVEYQANATYNINNRWGVFVEANNTIDGRSPRFLYYKAPGFRGMAGVEVQFLNRFQNAIQHRGTSRNFHTLARGIRAGKASPKARGLAYNR